MSADPPPPEKPAAPKKIPLSNAPAAPTETEVAKTPAPPPASSSGAKNPILHQSNKSPPGTKTPRTPHTPAPGSSAMPQPRPPHPRPDGPMTLTELAVPLRSRIWDLTDGRLVNGEWTRYDWKPNGDLKILEPFGGTVAEFETAMRTELDLPEREAPGVQFIKMIAEHEKYRDAHSNATRSAPVVGLFGGSLTGVTAQMWEVQDTEGRTRREFSDGRDAEAYVRKNVEIKVTKMTNKIKAAAAFTSAISEDQPGGKELRDAAKAAVSAAAKEEAAAAASSASGSSSGLKSNVVTHKVWTKYCAFDSEAAIAVAAARHTLTAEQLPALDKRLEDLVRGKTNGELKPRKKRLRSQVQDAVQVFAQVIEDEDGICVCDFMNALTLTPIRSTPKDYDDWSVDAKLEWKRKAYFETKNLNFKLLKDEPVVMLGTALQIMRPLRPRVIVVVDRRTMENTLRNLREDAANGGKGLRHLYPAMGWVIVPNGTDIAKAKASFMIALARVLHRHSIGVVCSGGQGVLNQMHLSALWDVPMMVLHGSGRMSDIWMKMWPKRLVQGFDADNVQDLLQACGGYQIDMQSAHQVREILKKGSIMLHKIYESSNAFERLFRIELSGDQLIETALRRLSSYGRTIKVYAKYKKPLAAMALYVGLAATFASVFVSNIEVFGSDSNQQYSKTTFTWIAVIAPAILVILNSIENFVNLNSMLVIAERAKAKVESMLHIYRLRALQFSDNFIDDERDRRAELTRLQRAIKRGGKLKPKDRSPRTRVRAGGMETDSDDSDGGGEEDGQESGDIITSRQAKLAQFLERINKDFSESGAVLLELSKLAARGTGPSTRHQNMEGKGVLQSLKHRRRVPSKSRAQRQTKPVVPDPDVADDSDDDLNPNMMSPLSMLDSMTGPMVRNLHQAQADALRASGLRDFRGGEYGGDVVSVPGARFSRDAQTVLDVDGRRVDVPGVGIRTEGGGGVTVPDTRARLPSSGEITDAAMDAGPMTDEDRRSMEFLLRRAGVDPANIPGLPRFDGRQIGAEGGEYGLVPPVNYDLLTPRSFETPGMELALPGYDLGFGGTEVRSTSHWFPYDPVRVVNAVS